MIDYGVWVARLVVAMVFGWAAVAKWSDRAGTRQAVEEFGVQARWISAVAWGLPVTELLVALAVLPSWTAVWAGAAALTLLAVSSTAVAVLLAKGQRPACSCFGAASAAPIGRATLARNAAIAALTGLAVWGSVARHNMPQALPADRAVGIAVIIGFAAVLAYQQLELGRLRRRMDAGLAGRTATDGLPIGVAAPTFELRDIQGDHHSLDKTLAAGLPVLLFFLHPGCAPCATIAAELPLWRERLDSAATIMVIGNDDPIANATWAQEYKIERMLVMASTDLVTQYRLRGTPSAVLIDARGRIASPARTGSYAIRELVDGLRPPR